VIVPNFGAFLTHRVSARIDENLQSFHPPRKTVSFNEQLQSNDGLLANYIAEVEKVPYTVAVEKIAKRVKSIKSYLTEGETIAFNTIGDLLLNKEGHINFEPALHINYLTDAFGLSPLTSTEVTRVVYKETVEQLEDTTPIALSAEKRHSRHYLKYAAIGLLFLGIGGFMTSHYYLKQVDSHNQIAQDEANQQLDLKIQEATFVMHNPLPAATLKVEQKAGQYHIVAGAFRIAENSDKKLDQLQAQGFKARKIGVNSYGLHEVAYSSHTDRIEAIKALKTIKRTHNRDAWLLVKTLE
jgi:hypothetical protein